MNPVLLLLITSSSLYYPSFASFVQNFSLADSTLAANPKHSIKFGAAPQSRLPHKRCLRVPNKRATRLHISPKAPRRQLFVFNSRQQTLSHFATGRRNFLLFPWQTGVFCILIDGTKLNVAGEAEERAVLSAEICGGVPDF